MECVLHCSQSLSVQCCSCCSFLLKGKHSERLPLWHCGREESSINFPHGVGPFHTSYKPLHHGLPSESQTSLGLVTCSNVGSCMGCRQDFSPLLISKASACHPTMYQRGMAASVCLANMLSHQLQYPHHMVISFLSHSHPKQKRSQNKRASPASFPVF